MPGAAGDDDRPFFHHFIAGQVGGMVGTFLCYPFDTAKTKAQMLNTTARNPFSVLRTMVIKEGLFSIYRGVLYPFIGYGSIFSVAFGVNGTCKDLVKKYKHSDEFSMAEMVVCGAFAGAVSSLVRTPVERVKCWAQIHQLSTLNATKDLVSKYGVLRGLLFGVTPTMTREIPKFGVYYPIYHMSLMLFAFDAKKEKHQKNGNGHGNGNGNGNGNMNMNMNSHKTSEMSATSIYLSGALAGIGCWVTVYPLDVIKTRMQASPPNTYKHLLHCARGIYAQGGVKGFYHGLVPTVYRAAALHSAIFLCYERVLDALSSQK